MINVNSATLKMGRGRILAANGNSAEFWAISDADSKVNLVSEHQKHLCAFVILKMDKEEGA